VELVSFWSAKMRTCEDSNYLELLSRSTVFGVSSGSLIVRSVVIVHAELPHSSAEIISIPLGRTI